MTDEEKGLAVLALYNRQVGRNLSAAATAKEWSKLGKSKKADMVSMYPYEFPSGQDSSVEPIRVYCTTFCNQGHDMKDGKPIGHECYILSPAKLAQEASGIFPDSPMPIEPRRIHPGKRAR